MSENLGVEFTSGVADGGVAHLLDTEVAYTSGSLLSLRNKTVEKFGFAYDGTLTLHGSLVADTITEKTAAAGVTVDELLIKDGGIPVGAVTAHEASLSIAWSQLTATPTTLAGYGITDAAPIAHISDVANPHVVTKSQVGLGSVENTALSTWGGTVNVTTIGEAAVTAHQAALALAWSQITSGIPTTLAGYGITDAAPLSHVSDVANPHSVTQSQVGLSAVENTALSTWAGTTNITTLGTISAGTWGGTAIDAGDLAGATLAAGVLASSLTSLGTLGDLTVTNPIVGSVTGSSGSATGNAATATALETARAINGVNFDGTAPITITAAAGTLTGTALNATVVTSSLTAVGTLLDLTVTNQITGSISGSSGSCTGLAATATALATPRDINGVAFDGTANITVTAAAGTLTGTELKSTVITSSLTSVGTLGDLTVTNPITGSVTGSAGSCTGNAATATLAATVTVVDSTSATCWVAVFDAATGSLAAKTDGGLTYAATTGILSATGFSGPLTGNVTGNVTGSAGSCTGNSATATLASTVVVVDESADTTCFPLFATAASGSLAAYTGTNLTFQSVTGVLGATIFDGPIGTGTATPAAGAFTTGTFSGQISGQDQVVLQGVTNDEGFVAELYSDTGPRRPALSLRHSLHPTRGSHTALTNDDGLGAILFQGSDGAAWFIGAYIEAKTTEAWTATDGGSKINIYTTPTNSVTRTLALTIGQDQSTTFAGAVVAQTTLAVTGDVAVNTTAFTCTAATGAWSSSGDGTVNGLTVGKGGGAQVTNSAYGLNALASNTTGNYNTAFGWSAMQITTDTNASTAVGYSALRNNDGANNTAVGYSALSALTTGASNTALGYLALNANSTGSGCVSLGAEAGRYETGSNALYIDNQNRTNTAGDKAGALLYGTFHATPASQTLTVNAALTVAQTATVVGGFGCNAQAAQTAYASGGALAAYTTGAFGLDSDANMTALHAMVVSIRAALVANGIMS